MVRKMIAMVNLNLTLSTSMNGMKEVIGLWEEVSESAKYWMGY